MKKYLIISLALFVAMFTQAQKSKVNSAYEKLGGDAAAFGVTKVDPAAVKEAKADIETALQDDYTKTWTKTYIVACQVYTESYKASKDVQDMFKAGEFIKKAEECNQTGDVKGKGKGKFNDDIKTEISQLKNAYINAGVDAYNANDFASAAKLFGASTELQQGELFAKDALPVDTAIYFNAAIAAAKANMHEDAIKYYKESAKYGYGGVTPYLYMTNEYIALGDTAGLISIVKEGLAKYPNDNQGLLMQLINIYLVQGNLDEAYNYITKALESDSNNASLYFAKGVIEEQKKSPDAAAECYKKAIEIDPKSADPQYNLGVLEFNKAVEIFNAGRDIKDNNEYNAQLEKAKNQFKVALPYFLKAAELDPKKSEYLTSLKQTYYRLGDEVNTKKIQDQLDAL